MASYPQRIVCLTEETTETLYLLGCGGRIVGISGFTVRPKEARLKPIISTYLDADIDAIIALKPDIVLAFSDLQATIVRDLTLRGMQVVAFNQRSVNEILQNILILGGIVGEDEKARALVARYETKMKNVRELTDGKTRPRVYFEEWDNPMISAIRWVSELVEIAGGEDIFPECRSRHDGAGRIVDAQEVLRRNPDIIIGSWCGKQFKPDAVMQRVGWKNISAVHDKMLFEIPSSKILQPGPAALTDGLDDLVRIISDYASSRSRLSTR